LAGRAGKYHGLFAQFTNHCAIYWMQNDRLDVRADIKMQSNNISPIMGRMAVRKIRREGRSMAQYIVRRKHDGDSLTESARLRLTQTALIQTAFV